MGAKFASLAKVADAKCQSHAERGRPRSSSDTAAKQRPISAARDADRKLPTKKSQPLHAGQRDEVNQNPNAPTPSGPSQKELLPAKTGILLHFLPASRRYVTPRKQPRCETSSNQQQPASRACLIQLQTMTPVCFLLLLLVLLKPKFNQVGAAGLVCGGAAGPCMHAYQSNAMQQDRLRTKTSVLVGWGMACRQ
jgi:hypothetical protein